MAKSNRRTRARHKLVETHYTIFYRGKKCYYCGDIASTMDHSPAISIAYATGVDYFTSQDIPLYKVSCCDECNILLGNKELNTLNERVIFIYNKLQKLTIII